MPATARIRIPARGCLAAQVSCYANAYATDGVYKRRTIAAVLSAMQDTTFQRAIESLRRLLAEDNRTTYDAQKPQLPAVTFGGTFGHRGNEHLETHTGLILLEIDFPRKHPELLPEAEDLRDKLAKDPCVAIAMVSPSGAGVHVAFTAPPLDTDTAYKLQWDETRRYLETSYNVTVDKGNDIARLWFCTWDPGLHSNPDALEFPGYRPARLLHALAMRLWNMQDHERDVTRNLVAHTLGGKIAAGTFDEAYVLAYFQPIVEATTQHPEKQWRKFQSQLHRGKRRPLLDTTPGQRPPRPVHRNGHINTAGWREDAIMDPWREKLLVKKNGEPTTNVANVGLILANHPTWHERFWFDAVRGRPMLDNKEVTDEVVMEVSQWLGVHERLGITNIRMVEQCIHGLCLKFPRDLLQTYLHTRPPWDGIPRLEEWLSDIAETEKTEYGMAISRLIPVSMVARALNPGCLYRYVVILEGLEASGKTSLVQALAGEAWYVELSLSLDSKEAQMMLRGSWVAELAELHSLTRTEETRMKSFITLKDDVWIPKYSNSKVYVPRRTIMIGTTNEDSYLKGESGNTRYLPIRTGQINVPAFLEIRDQLFAEAIVYYYANLGTWWKLPDAAETAAAEEREARRVINVYEESLREWLTLRDLTETTWQEIAEGFLQLEAKMHWRDKALQMQIMSALRALGWQKKTVRRDGKLLKVWHAPAD